MAAPKHETKQYTADRFVESAGAILFKVSTRQMCILYHHTRGEWLLAKGRRNVGESRRETAIRESREETGFRGHLLPINMLSRCTPDTIEQGFTPDRPRPFEGICEPFMITHRLLPHDTGVKLIWWYIGAIDELAPLEQGEPELVARLFDLDEVARKAAEIFMATYGEN